MAFEIILTPEAREDLFSIYLWIAGAAGLAVAEAYDARIRAACRTLSEYPRRGTPRSDLGSEVRSIPFERQATIAYRVVGETVEILAIAHRGRELGEPID